MTVRGAALVDTVIDRVRSGEADFDIAWPDPLPMDLLHGLALPGGLPLPPSLRRWLAFDGAWLERVTACWGGPSYPAFRAVTVAQAVRELIAADFWEPFQWIETYGRTPVLALDGEHSVRLLLLDDPDEYGEYPVLQATVRDGAEVHLVALGFDTWLAHMCGLMDDPLGTDAELDAARSRLGCDDNGLPIAPEPRSPRTGPADSAPASPPPLPPHTWVERPFQLPGEASAGMLARALAQAIPGRDRARVRFLLTEAQRRFPAEQRWKDAALAAAVPDHEWLLDDLLSAGADPNARPLSRPVLHQAARHDDPGPLRRLLDAGGDLRAHGLHGFTALHDAAEALRPVNAALLVARGADATASDMDGRSPLWWAVQTRSSLPAWREPTVDTVRVLLEAGADPNADSARASTSVLHLAVEADLGAAVTLLIDRGADVAYRDRRGITAAELAWQHNRRNAAEALGTDDPLSPRRLDIRLGDGRGEHELSVSLTMAFPVGVYGLQPDPYRIDSALRALERFAQAGVLGLHRFPPGTSSARWDGPEFALPDQPGPRDAPIGPCVVDGTYRVCDVAPEAVGLWLHALVESTARIVAVTIHSNQADATTDRADWRKWFTDPPWSDLRPWPDLPFPVTEANAPGRVCVVTADPAHHDSIEWAFTDHVTAVVSELLMMPHAPWVDNGGRNGTHQLFTADSLDVPDRSPSPATADVLRTVALSVLARIAAEDPGAITAVEWNVLTDGATAVVDASA